jgi:phosphate-selective porin OprO/OprP
MGQMRPPAPVPLIVVLAAFASSAVANEPPTKTANAAVVRVSASAADGFAIAADGFKLQFKGLVQFDGRFYLQDTAGTAVDSFLLRRARPILQGTVGGCFDFNFTPDFGVGSAVIQDAYAVARISRPLAIRVGKFKPPIGLEHLQSDAHLLFPERALPASLEPNRDVGVQLQGELASAVLAYAAGVFNGTSDGASLDWDNNDGKSVVGRVVVSPFAARRSLLRGLGVGFAASTERQSSSSSLSSYRTAGQQAFLAYVQGVAADGSRRRLSPELSFFAGRFGLLAEHVSSKGWLRKAGDETGNRRALIANRAWQVTASVFLTADEAGYDGPKLSRPLDAAKRQWGGVQLAARVNGFDADGSAFELGLVDPKRSARSARAFGVVLSWYLSRNLRETLSYERTRFVGGAAGGADRPPENALIVRTQLAF